jgi:predicted ribosome-associated RNA-binding protein Tma20
MNYQTLIFSGHAIKQMFQRRISRDQVKCVLADGEVIAAYPNDHPFPSYLLLGYVESQRPLHVVAAHDSDSETVYVITAYEPDSSIWNQDFRARRK